MNKYILMIILCMSIGCASTPDVKDNKDNKDNAKKHNTIKKMLFWFWVVS